MCYLDSNIVMYYIENPPHWGLAAEARVVQLLDRGSTLMVSDLTRMECRVRPLRAGNTKTLDEFDAFFSSSRVHVTSLTAAVCDKASEIRAKHRIRPLDALHLAAALESRCDLFLTNDRQLRSFSEIAVEVLV
jgi:predicted nucleic acid-binding protein